MTDIVVTVGPACESEEIMEQMILAGANVFRFPFARDSFAVNEERTIRVREVAKRVGRGILTMQDLPGRKLRIAAIESLPVVRGDRILLGAHDPGPPFKFIPLSHRPPPELSSHGEVVYFGDGEVEARVSTVTSSGEVECEVVNDGVIYGERGITFQGDPRADDGVVDCAVTDNDAALIRRGASLKYDMVALSFVGTENDIIHARAIASESDDYAPRIVAKIENSPGVTNIRRILGHCEGVMVARGDLALQVPYERLPRLQLEILSAAKSAGVYSIVATQMLDSVDKNRVPSRAEVIDIANAVYQEASAVMLSGETRTGTEPVYAVEVMAKIVRQAEIDKNDVGDRSK